MGMLYRSPRTIAVRCKRSAPSLLRFCPGKSGKAAASSASYVENRAGLCNPRISDSPRRYRSNFSSPPASSSGSASKPAKQTETSIQYWSHCLYAASPSSKSWSESKRAWQMTSQLAPLGRG
eukprot:scaffold7832_cov267-Pinguiococcus_pyrenoidosus.AAC.5